MTLPLFAAEREVLSEGAVLLRRFADGPALRAEIARISERAPFRHMVTRGGLRMSVAMTNCGEVGWVSDRRGYRYDALDPETGLAWPAMPDAFRALARSAASAVGYGDFSPDACLVNRYEPGSKMGLHQDRDERDFAAPIVSVSIGLPATFRWGGDARSDSVASVPLYDGDVVVFGGAARLRFHGVATLAAGAEPYRFNLTFRRAR